MNAPAESGQAPVAKALYEVALMAASVAVASVPSGGTQSHNVMALLWAALLGDVNLSPHFFTNKDNDNNDEDENTRTALDAKLSHSDEEMEVNATSCRHDSSTNSSDEDLSSSFSRRNNNYSINNNKNNNRRLSRGCGPARSARPHHDRRRERKSPSRLNINNNCNPPDFTADMSAPFLIADAGPQPADWWWSHVLAADLLAFVVR